jgi:hypothetical protein
LEQRLPRILVPLADKDADVSIDLQKVFDDVYDLGAYSRILDYRKAPTEALTPAQARWANKLLRERGLRRGRS